MTLKSSFRVALNTINCSEKGTQPLPCGMPFHLVFAEDTFYFHFVAVKGLAACENQLEVDQFIRLITRVEFVSLTYNSLYLDLRNRKFIFRPRMLPCYWFEFDLLDGNFGHLRHELEESSDELGFLKVHDLVLDPLAYEEGDYHEALELLDTDD